MRTFHRPILRITVLALLSIIGICGMLLVDGVWDWLLFALAAMPLLLAGVLTVSRNTGLRDKNPPTR